MTYVNRPIHNLAKAVEKRDGQAAQDFYDRLAAEVSGTLQKYPDIVATLKTMSQMTDEDMERSTA